MKKRNQKSNYVGSYEFQLNTVGIDGFFNKGLQKQNIIQNQKQ